MELNDHGKLGDIILAYAEQIRGHRPLSIAELVDHILDWHADEIEPWAEMLKREGLYQRCRRVVKHRSADSERLTWTQLTLNFGIDGVVFADSYAVPLRDEEPLGDKEWIATADLTVPEAEKAAAALAAQVDNDSRALQSLRLLIDIVKDTVGTDSGLTIGQASLIARQRREENAECPEPII